MLRVTVELVPCGIEAQKRELGRMEIGNLSGGEFSDYGVRYDDDCKARGNWTSFVRQHAVTMVSGRSWRGRLKPWLIVADQ